MGFSWQANSSTSNYLTFGFNSADRLVNMYATGQLAVTTTINATDTITGSITTPGGISSGQDLFVKQTGHFNYGGSSASAQIKVSPSTNAGESSSSYYQNTSEGGARWSIGHNTGSGGSDTFGIWSSTKNANTVTISNTGIVSVPSAIAATSTTTGAITTTGGISSALDIYVANTGHFNYGGATTSAQVKVSPATTNGEASASFYSDVSEGGTRWSLGHNAGSVGSGNFGLWNSSKGVTMKSIASTGVCDFPFGISLNSGSTLSVYSTGSWTPTLTVDSGIGFTPSYTARSGWFVRIGDMVTITFNIDFGYVNTFTPNVLWIQGLPFAIDTSKSFGAVGSVNWPLSGNIGFANGSLEIVIANSTSLALAVDSGGYVQTAGTQTNQSNAGSLTYFV